MLVVLVELVTGVVLFTVLLLPPEVLVGGTVELVGGTVELVGGTVELVGGTVELVGGTGTVELEVGGTSGTPCSETLAPRILQRAHES